MTCKDRSYISHAPDRIHRVRNTNSEAVKVAWSFDVSHSSSVAFLRVAQLAHR